jgi:hypothetical protein
MKIINVRSLLAMALFAASLLTAGCGGGGTPAGVTVGAGGGGGGTAANVQSISVNGGPLVSATPSSIYPNGVFTSVTVCVPGSASCQTIDDVLVDTGSYGLRLLTSAVTSITLPTLAATSGSGSLMNCVSFVDLSYLWGPVAVADIKLGTSEVASSSSLQLISTATNVPTSCSNGGTADDDTVATLGSNGILGVGPEPNDCGPACDPSFTTTPPTGDPYYNCTSSSCTAALVPQANQVTNPVVLFADNNGVVMELPALTSGAEAEATLSGSLIFGINTQSNNQLPSTASVFTLNQFDNFTVNFPTCVSSAGGPGVCDFSFIDSGSNAYFFPDSSIPSCTDNGFFCPTGLTALSATNVDPNTGFSKTVSFSVDNADTLFATNNFSDAVFSTLGGTNSADSFDWGLPFFYGMNVFTGIDQLGIGGPGPFWAY